MNHPSGPGGCVFTKPSRDAVGFLCCKGTLVVLVHLTAHLDHQVVFIQSYFTAVHTPACTNVWYNPLLGARFAFASLTFVRLLPDHYCSLSSSFRIPVLPSCALAVPPLSWCHLHVCGELLFMPS